MDIDIVYSTQQGTTSDTLMNFRLDINVEKRLKLSFGIGLRY